MTPRGKTCIEGVKWQQQKTVRYVDTDRQELKLLQFLCVGVCIRKGCRSVCRVGFQSCVGVVKLINKK